MNTAKSAVEVTLSTKPYNQMSNLELTHQRMALETLNGGCDDWREWQKISDEFCRRGMVSNSEKCQGRANYYERMQNDGLAAQ